MRNDQVTVLEMINLKIIERDSLEEEGTEDRKLGKIEIFQGY